MTENRKVKLQKNHIYFLQCLLVAGITFGSQSLNLKNKDQWFYTIARYIVYVLTIQASKSLSVLVCEVVHRRRDLTAKLNGLANDTNWHQVGLFLFCCCMLHVYEQKLYGEDFPLIFIAYLVAKYPEVEKKAGKAMVTYGTGMACSFIEGYLVHSIPPDGAQFRGFVENIRLFESAQGVVFPVKKLFIIVTKSMHCPPDLNEFNDKSGREDVPRLEASRAFETVTKDVAGVKGRQYRNTAYKIMRHNKKPVYIAAECATGIHTLYRVMKNRDLYEELADVNVEDIVYDYVNLLNTVLPKSPELRNKCEIIEFDDTNPDMNLAEVLLDRIRELEPNFEELINRKM